MHLLLLVVACKPTVPNTPEPEPAPAPAPAPVEPAPTPVEPTPAPAPGPGTQGTACAADGKCVGPPDGLACIEYYGIAGPRGPKFTSCEIACASPDVKCPDGQVCITVADGPGAVCRAKP